MEQILQVLTNNQVEFVLIGGVAARAHGSSRLTEDIDIVYRRTAQNLARIVEALAPYRPYLRGAPPGLPFQWNAETLQRGLNFTLKTTLGAIDLLGEVAGGTYEDLVQHTISLPVFNMNCLCVDLEKLIELKRAAGRPKDLEAIAELEALRDLQAEY